MYTQQRLVTRAVLGGADRSVIVMVMLLLHSPCVCLELRDYPRPCYYAPMPRIEKADEPRRDILVSGRISPNKTAWRHLTCISNPNPTSVDIFAREVNPANLLITDLELTLNEHSGINRSGMLHHPRSVKLLTPCQCCHAVRMYDDLQILRMSPTVHPQTQVRRRDTIQG